MCAKTKHTRALFAAAALHVIPGSLTVLSNFLYRGLCEYTREWVEHVPEEPVAAQLLDGCAWLHNPIALEVGPGIRVHGGD